MKCISEQMLFDFAQNELPSEQRVTIQQHLAQCTTCRLELEKINERRALVQDSIQNLNEAAVAIPKFTQPLFQTTFVKKIRFHYQWHRKLFYATKFAVITAVLLLCLILNQQKEPHSEDAKKIQQALSNWDQYFESNPKKDWNEMRFILSVYHPQNNTVQYIQNSVNPNEVKKITINIDDIQEK